MLINFKAYIKGSLAKKKTDFATNNSLLECTTRGSLMGFM